MTLRKTKTMTRMTKSTVTTVIMTHIGIAGNVDEEHWIMDNDNSHNDNEEMPIVKRTMAIVPLVMTTLLKVEITLTHG